MSISGLLGFFQFLYLLIFQVDCERKLLLLTSKMSIDMAWCTVHWSQWLYNGFCSDNYCTRWISMAVNFWSNNPSLWSHNDEDGGGGGGDRDHYLVRQIVLGEMWMFISQDTILDSSVPDQIISQAWSDTLHTTNVQQNLKFVKI